MPESSKPTIVLVHGAWADASSWNAVTAPLQAEGFTVLAPPNELRGLTADAAYIASFLAQRTSGPVVLVGHSYGGAVITNVHDPKVQSLVYIAAFGPVEGEPVQITIDPIRFPGSQLLPPALGLKIVDDPHAIGGKNVDGYVTDEYFHSVFAQDVSDETAATMLAHQKSAALWANLELGGPPSWANTPSWYLVAGEDRVIPASAQRFMANRMGANTSELPTSHASLVSQPGAVADVIVAAAHG
jgi:pimeloyl-ACP methyl ester carboxylesterase